METKITNAGSEIRSEPEYHTTEARSESESTNSSPIELIYEEFLNQSESFDLEPYWESLEGKLSIAELAKCTA